MSTYVQLMLIGYLLIVPACSVLYLSKAVSASILTAIGAVIIASGVAPLLLTRIPDIISLNLLGLQATLERQIGKAEVTITQLQNLATAMADASLTEIAMSGEMLRSLSPQKKFQLHQRIIDSLKEINVPEDKIKDAQQFWVHVNANVLLGEIQDEAMQSNPSATTEINNLPEDNQHGAPTPSTLKKWAASQQHRTEKLNQLVEAYEYLWSTGSMKDPAIIEPNRVMRMK